VRVANLVPRNLYNWPIGLHIFKSVIYTYMRIYVGVYIHININIYIYAYIYVCVYMYYI